MSLPTKPQSRAGMLPRRARVLLGASAKVGKALALDTPLATPDGWTTMGEVSEGDVLFDREGIVTSVTATTEVMYDHPCVRVYMRSSEPIVADADHLWIVLRGRKEMVVTTDGLEIGDRVPVASSLRCVHASLPMDPYTLGVWLGDGSSSAALVHLFSDDYDEIAAEMALPLERRREKAHTVTALVGRGEAQRVLRSSGLLADKHIPTSYLRASRDQRMALLRGIMDTDGHVSPKGLCEITTVHQRFAEGLLELASSLGFKAWSGEGRATIAGRDCGPKWRITFHPGDAPVCALSRKRRLLRPLLSTRTAYRKITALEPIASVPVRCLQVDSPTRTYLAGRQLVPTHNTTLLANWAPDTTLIVDTHHGTELLDGEHYVSHVRNWPEFVSLVTDVCCGGHNFHTIGIDLVGDLWRFADLHFGTSKDGMKIPASAVSDYGRSSAKARSAFEVELGRLLAAPVGIWFLAHLREKTDKEGQLTVYAPDMDKAVHGYIMGAVDFVWLAETQKNGRRVVHTQPTAHFEAGSRVSLPSPLPMDAAEVARAMDRALNPQDYDADGKRKQAEPDPEPVAPTPEAAAPATAPPAVKDLQRTGESDATPSDSWVEGIRDRAKPFAKELREAITGLGGAVPHNVSSWSRVLADLEPAQRRAFEAWLTTREEQTADVPWTDEQHAEASAEAEAQLDLDEARAVA